MSKLSRTKGADFEREIAKKLRAVWPSARRNLSQTRTAKREGGDILGVPFHLEAKTGASVSIPAAWRQAVRDRGDGAYPVLVVARDLGCSARVYFEMGYSTARLLVSADFDDWLAVVASGATVPAP